MRRGENGSGVRRRVKNDTAINKSPSHAIVSLAPVERRKRTILFRNQRRQFTRFHGTISHRHVHITLQHRRRNCPISKSLAPLPPDFIVSRHRSEEHTSELQSLTNLVCRLLLEKKKQQK